MKKTLYISDLDGTLLNHNQEVSEQTKEILNKLISKGLNFSIATARTAVTAEEILKELNINIPVVLMNGVSLYDLKKHEHVDIEYIGSDTAQTIISCLEDVEQSGFIYTIDKNSLRAYYHKALNKYETIFYNQRKHKKQFVKEKNIDTSKIAYFVFMDEKEKMEAIANKIKHIPGIDYVLYKDNYMEGAYLLEIFSHRASKANAILKLKKNYKQLVCFGDNLNDISMFKIADYSCAMGNAVDAVKDVATQVIATNQEDGVAKFIEKCMK